MSPESYLRGRGLEPLAWDGALRRIEQRLGPADAETFARLHRAFVAYPAEHTCRAFYDFAARGALHDLLACFRFDRLRAIARSLEDLPLRGARVLDFGAGGGFLAGWMRDVHGASVVVSDLSPAAEERLAAEDFPLLCGAAEPSFDVVLCADSLGEIHADEDDRLSDPSSGDAADYPEEVEARYGLAHKLAPLGLLLKPGGTVRLFEPVDAPHFWRGAGTALERAGWNAKVEGPDPAWSLRLAPKKGA